MKMTAFWDVCSVYSCKKIYKDASSKHHCKVDHSTRLHGEAPQKTVIVENVVDIMASQLKTKRENSRNVV
jgi:hypothetical protein